MAEFESPELRRLAVDLDVAAQAAPAEVRKVIAKGALNIKTDAQRRAAGIAHAPNYPRSITYDSHETAAGGWAEIGPDKDKHVGGGPKQTPGDLGHLFEYGGPRNAPIPHMGPAGDAELPRFERAIADLGERLLR